eukprot:scaffold32393_cov126-Isochrysis_galbana.AAC.2
MRACLLFVYRLATSCRLAVVLRRNEMSNIARASKQDKKNILVSFKKSTPASYSCGHQGMCGNMQAITPNAVGGRRRDRKGVHRKAEVDTTIDCP